MSCLTECIDQSIDDFIILDSLENYAKNAVSKYFVSFLPLHHAGNLGCCFLYISFVFQAENLGLFYCVSYF